MRWHTVLISLILPTILLGCLRGPKSETAGNDFFRVILTSSRSCADPGEPISLQATATNVSSQTRIVELNDKPVFDIVIGNPDHGALRWSDGKPLTPDLTRLALKPGESKSIEMQWVSDGKTPVAAWLIYDSRFLNDPLIAGFNIPLTTLNCPGIGP